jgi:hypothetical protein
MFGINVQKNLLYSNSNISAIQALENYCPLQCDIGRLGRQVTSKQWHRSTKLHGTVCNLSHISIFNVMISNITQVVCSSKTWIICTAYLKSIPTWHQNGYKVEIRPAYKNVYYVKNFYTWKFKSSRISQHINCKLLLMFQRNTVPSTLGSRSSRRYVNTVAPHMAMILNFLRLSIWQLSNSINYIKEKFEEK